MSHQLRPWAAHGAYAPNKRPVLRVISAILLFLFLFTSTAVGLLYHDLDTATKRVDVLDLLGNRPKSTTPNDSFAGTALNILVIGSDFRKDKEYDDAGEEITGMRADTTMVMHISADRQRVEVVSIPRDTLVDRPACKLSNGKTIPASSYPVMFNEAFSVAGQTGDTAAAAACVIGTVEKLSGIFIDQYVVVDFDGFKAVIEALGGVKMCLPQRMEDQMGTVNLPAGHQTLNAEQALGFARARYLGDGSDISRIGRQQALMGAIVKEASSRNFFTDFPTLYAFLRASLKALTTSPALGSLSNMGGLALSLSSINLENIHFITMPVAPALTDKNRVVPTEVAEDVWKALNADTSVPLSIGYRDFTGKEVAPQSSPDPRNTLDPQVTPSPGATDSPSSSAVPAIPGLTPDGLDPTKNPCL